MSASAGSAFDQAFEPIPGVSVQLRRAGHLLGAASVRVEWDGGTRCCSRVTSGRQHDLLMPPPGAAGATDWLVVESTYGDRVHAPVDPLTMLADVVNRTAARGGVVVVPGLRGGSRAGAAVLPAHAEAGRPHPRPAGLPEQPDGGRRDAHLRRASGRTPADAGAVRSHQRRRPIVNSVDESKRLNELRMPAVIISASGMASGGRVLHHLKAFAPDHRNSILFAGFQAAGTRGASIVGGATTSRSMASTCRFAPRSPTSALSAHADRNELLGWIGALPAAPRRVFVTHGEPVAADALRQAIEERHGWPCRCRSTPSRRV